MRAGLEPFVARQAETHAAALAELRAGRKVTHWIWWELPQLRGLGRSPRAFDYGLEDLDEAAAYLAHPVLGPRLIEMCEALLGHADQSAEAILGPVDALKVRSTATLFSHVDNAPDVFRRVLDTFYDGVACSATEAEISL